MLKTILNYDAIGRFLFNQNHPKVKPIEGQLWLERGVGEQGILPADFFTRLEPGICG